MQARSRPRKVGSIVDLQHLLSNICSAAKKNDKSEEQLELILRSIHTTRRSITISAISGPIRKTSGNRGGDDSQGNGARSHQRRRNPGLTTDEDKDNSAYVDGLGWVLFRRGQIDEAQELGVRRRSATATTVIFDHLGDVYVRLKMQAEAGRAFQAIELYQNGARGKDEERTRDLQRKLKEVQMEIGGR